jgi:hypothetical protein
MGKVSFDDSSLESMENSFVRIMTMQKDCDDSFPQKEKLGIGGQIQLMVMT